ncbi:MurR/RpiR family transcriptional regulator [Clostridium sp. CM028]|uniref:MurR/RpiR family transcriptional regulator n=1 Tax=unclassified Clostridium TaxID=2614128 RepID=UPI001C0C8C03|nr:MULTISPECIES: MurR/RpiR family transcriptional regulator [unclassified Clostridium]MBU3092104.1 MurR/RpiR family transcriptional regulator [Clostridium sp. CF011]MBW9146650.1 MurR/RpiR family transcriptional regulator [Clostridium sp. CM027]MBW9149086.1 MurR/RpiR family transcriptional regulator [Clostridium sp. CM028]UVE42029.1 MurR/RpiR family transcriptional regulator [Clostridium sp. CM027]WAG71053.1 MurR/RpiR family transcriptional regulator [Clostridium sp. CF011]
MNVLQYIRQNYDSFTDSEKLIANYLLETKKSIISMSAKDIAYTTKTSAPTVVRFAKKIGFNSLNEMKLKLSINLDKMDQDIGFQYLDKDLGTKNIIHVIKNSVDSIMEQTVRFLKEDELDNAIELLINAKNIYVFSVGVSALVGQDLYYKLSRINKRCISHTDTHLQITSSILMEPGDVAIAISYSGETREVIKCVENAKKRKVPVIAITKASVNNKIADISDVVLRVPAVEKSLREGAISSRISQLAIIDMLFIGMVRNNIKEVEEILIETREAVKELYK